MKIINEILKIFILVTITNCFKLGQKPQVDNAYRQANLPPIIAALIDIPAYGEKELFKWNDFIQANTLLISKNNKKKHLMGDEIYEDRFKRIAKLRAQIFQVPS